MARTHPVHAHLDWMGDNLASRGGNPDMVSDYQPKDSNGKLIVRNARISHYLGSFDGRDRYVLELPEGEAHQTGPYEMRRER